ncbi:MAG: hypothetical protein K1X83_08780 [Oligoflexia bacterium]|nr:hypothetical protein [Oligoflexia bacterium]
MIDKHLRNLGLHRVEENLGEIAASALQQLKAAIKNSRIKSSYLKPGPTQGLGMLLCLDIGGTSTRCALFDPEGGGEWGVLFEAANTDLKPAGQDTPGASFKTFAAVVAKRIAESPAMQLLKAERLEIDGLGIVWSQAQTSVPKEWGIEALVYDRAHYAKGEWFIRDLLDGDPIGLPFREELTRQGLNVRRTIVSNDVVLTMLALPEAHAGMVMSTGLNATVLLAAEERRYIHNAQFGDQLQIDSKYRSTADFLEAGKTAHTIEFLSAGKFLPALFASHITKLHELGVKELQSVAAFLRANPKNLSFSAADMGDLLHKPAVFQARYGERMKIEPEALALLGTLSAALIKRAGKLGAIVGFASISTQFEECQNFTIALDSRLSRELRELRQTMEAALPTILPKGISAKFELLSPTATLGGEVSVPMLGLAQALAQTD